MTSDRTTLLRDLARGKEGEDVVQKFLSDTYGVLTRNVGPLRLGWDLEVVGIDETHFLGRQKATNVLDAFVKDFGSTFEIKRDATSDRTGNVYWECWSNIRVHNPGCMLSCKADTIVFVRKQELLFLNRPMFLSWLYENLFLQTPLALEWKAKTNPRGDQRMMSAKNNPDVQGILIPVVHIKNSPASFFVFSRPTL